MGIRASASSGPKKSAIRSRKVSTAGRSWIVLPLWLTLKATLGFARAMRATCSVMWLISVAAVLRNLRRAGVLKNRLRTSMVVPAGQPHGAGSLTVPPSAVIRPPWGASAGRLVSGHVGDRADAGEGLAAKAHGLDVVEIVLLLQLGGGVRGQGQRQVLEVDAAAVVDDLDEFAAALLDVHLDVPGAGVEGVLQELLDDAGGPFDDLAGGDLVLQVQAQGTNPTHSFLTSAIASIPQIRHYITVMLEMPADRGRLRGENLHAGGDQCLDVPGRASTPRPWRHRPPRRALRPSNLRWAGGVSHNPDHAGAVPPDRPRLPGRGPEDRLPGDATCSGGVNYGDADPAVRQQAQELTRAGLDRAAWLGTDALLVVPGGRGDLERAGTAGGLRRRPGTRRSTCCSRLREDAEDRGVHIAIENVWNRFLLSPVEMRDLIDRVNNPWVGAYFDIGNAMAFGYPQDWIDVLGRRIVRVHAKDYDLAAAGRRRLRLSAAGRLGRLASGDGGAAEGRLRRPADVRRAGRPARHRPAAAADPGQGLRPYGSLQLGMDADAGC